MRRQPKKRRGAPPAAAEPKAGVAPQRMKAAEVVARVSEMIAPLCAAEAIELVLVEYRREPGGRVLRLIIDKPGGVRVDDCAAISRQASDFLDVALGIEEAYRLEVTSPGTERPLVRAEDFDRFKGHTVRIRTRQALDGRKNFKGDLQGMTDGAVRVLVDGSAVEIPFGQIEKAHLAG